MALRDEVELDVGVDDGRVVDVDDNQVIQRVRKRA